MAILAYDRSPEHISISGLELTRGWNCHQHFWAWNFLLSAIAPCLLTVSLQQQKSLFQQLASGEALASIYLKPWTMTHYPSSLRKGCEKENLNLIFYLDCPHPSGRSPQRQSQIVARRIGICRAPRTDRNNNQTNTPEYSPTDSHDSKFLFQIYNTPVNENCTVPLYHHLRK